MEQLVPAVADNDLGELRSEVLLVGKRTASLVASDAEDSDWDSSFVASSLPQSQQGDQSCGQSRDLLLEEVEKLQREVAELERRVAEKEEARSLEDERLSSIMESVLLQGRIVPLNETNPLAASLIPLPSASKAVVADMFETLEHATQQLEVMRSLTGMDLRRVYQEVLSEDESMCRRHHVLEAESNGIKFKAEYVTMEIKIHAKTSEESDTQQRKKMWHHMFTETSCQHEQLPLIEELRVSLPPAIQENMKEFLERVEKDRNLRSFLLTMVHFADWHRIRLKIFERLLVMYPKLVQRSDPNSKSRLVIHAGPRLCFLFKWVPLISSEGEVSSEYCLTSEYDKDVPLTDHLRSFLTSLTEHFEHVVEIIGIENALDQVLQALSKATH